MTNVANVSDFPVFEDKSGNPLPTVDLTSAGGVPFMFESPKVLPDISSLVAHPLAAENPQADAYEKEGMKDSIGKIGIQHPIVLYPVDGKLTVLDGLNRLDAGKAIGYRFRLRDFAILKGNPDEAAVFANAVNNHRRHLSHDQKEKRAKELIAKYPAMSTRKLAVMAGVSHTTIAKLRQPPEDNGKLRTLVRAWTNANVIDQEQFVKTYRLDLDEMLKALRGV